MLTGPMNELTEAGKVCLCRNMVNPGRSSATAHVTITQALPHAVFFSQTVQHDTIVIHLVTFTWWLVGVTSQCRKLFKMNGPTDRRLFENSPTDKHL